MANLIAPICHRCQIPMYRNGTRHNAQRWRCSKCGALDSGRNGAAKGLRQGPRYSLAAFMALVVQGKSKEEISQALDIGLPAVEHRMAAVNLAAQARCPLRPPGVGSGWIPVALPTTTQQAGLAAIGTSRGNRPRLLGWECGLPPVALAALVRRFGPPRLQVANQQEWIDQALQGVASWPEGEERLWIMLARSNGWILD